MHNRRFESVNAHNNKGYLHYEGGRFSFLRMMNDIKWVWVDLDDTIWDFRGNSWETLGELYCQEGLDAYFVSVDDWREKYFEYNHSLWPLYNAGKITKEYLQVERFRKVLADAGFPQEQVMAKSQELDPKYLSILGTKSQLVDGAREMLQYIKDKGYKMGLISNGFYEVQYRKMKSSQIDHFFDVVVLSDDVGVNKPDSRIFAHALRKAGATAEESIIIGDNPDADIKGAVDAGWKAIYFNRDGGNFALELPQGVVVVDRLCDVGHIL